MIALRDAGEFAYLLTESAAAGPPPFTALTAGFHNTFVQMSWQALPSYGDRLLEWTSTAGLSDGELIAARSTALRLFFRIQNQVLGEVVRHLQKIGLDHCLIKGTANRFDLYACPEDRGGIDLDLAIAADAAQEGRRAARDLGFVQSAWDEAARTFVRATSEQEAWIDENHYELGFLIRRHAVENLSHDQAAAIRRQIPLQPNPWHEIPGGGLGVWINLDLHTGLSHDIPVGEMMRASRNLRHSEVEYSVPSRGWELFHSIYKIYWEGVFSYGKGVYQYADLCRVVPRLTEDDCDEFVSLARRWRLEAAALYVLGRLPRAFEVPLPDRLQKFLATSAHPPIGVNPQEENNFGDVWSKLWGYR